MNYPVDINAVIARLQDQIGRQAVEIAVKTQLAEQLASELAALGPEEE